MTRPGERNHGDDVHPRASSTVDRPDQMGKDMFLKLLVAQMRYQDPANPADSSQMMAQTATFTQVEKLEQLVNQNASMLVLQESATAGALVGRTATYTDTTGAAVDRHRHLGPPRQPAQRGRRRHRRRRGPGRPHHRDRRHHDDVLTASDLSAAADRRPHRPEELLPMLRSMFSAISGLRAHQTKMDVTGNNIANVNTVGFKGSQTVFQDTLSQVIRAGGAPAADRGGTNPAQVGLGVKVAAITTNWTQGATQSTGRSTDFMIEGDGFFVTRAGTEQLYTRAGSFDFDGNGKLVTPDGSVLQGWMADADRRRQPQRPDRATSRSPTARSSPAADHQPASSSGNLPADARPPATVVQTGDHDVRQPGRRRRRSSTTSPRLAGRQHLGRSTSTTRTAPTWSPTPRSRSTRPAR